MPLPLKTYRVFPNPWLHIDPEKGPQAACTVAMRDDMPHVRFVGAVREAVKIREASTVTVGSKQIAGPVGSKFAIGFSFPNLDASLVKGTPETVSAVAPDGHYYRDRLVDGSLIPGDEATLRAVPEARFKSLDAAKAAGVAEFDAHFGEGSWAELEKLLSDGPRPTPGSKPSSPNKTTTEGNP
jgi:hypothetical protein